MSRWFQAGVLFAAASVAGYSQTVSAAEMGKTLTGCLESNADGYTLTVGGERVELLGDADFAKHTGHTVKLTGEAHGEKYHVASLEHVSPQCDPSGMTGEHAKMAPRNPADAAKDRAHDREAKGPTAQDQGGSKSDREITAQIRRMVVEDDTLSTYAHNVKIITKNGHVTLRGPVRSTEEKASVAAKAEAVIGDAVDNQLTIKPKSN